jgi:predicted ArsR family transcriptional regulator
VPDAEAPTRLIVVLSRLLAGLDALGAERGDAWRVVTRAALDSIPALRLAVMDALLEADAELSTTMVATAVRHPTQTARRALEDLAAHGVAARRTHGDGKSHTWTLTEWTVERYRPLRTVPETSGGRGTPTVPETSAGLTLSNNSLSNIEEDFSGKVPATAAEDAEAERIAAKFGGVG